MQARRRLNLYLAGREKGNTAMTRILVFLLLLASPAAAQTSGCIAQANNCPRPLPHPVEQPPQGQR